MKLCMTGWIDKYCISGSQKGKESKHLRDRYEWSEEVRRGDDSKVGMHEQREREGQHQKGEVEIKMRPHQWKKIFER